MKEKEKILKELRKKEFNEFLKEKEFLSSIIGQALNIDEKIIEEYLQENQEFDSAYDIVARITDTRIKLKTTKYNKIISHIPERGEYYKKWYDEEKQEYKIKIFLDKIFEKKYKKIEQEQRKNIEELFKEEPLTKEDILNIMIAELGIKYAKNLKISISGII